MIRRAVSLLVGIGAVIVLAGCQRMFTREHFEMVQVGDDQEEVRQTLGRPTANLQDQWLYDTTKGHYSAVIYFDDHGRVTSKEWMDAKSGAWEGRNPNANEPQEGEVRERDKRTTRIDED